MEKYGLEISMIISGQRTLYNEMAEQPERLPMDIVDLYMKLEKVESFW